MILIYLELVDSSFDSLSGTHKAWCFSITGIDLQYVCG